MSFSFSDLHSETGTQYVFKNLLQHCYMATLSLNLHVREKKHLWFLIYHNVCTIIYGIEKFPLVFLMPSVPWVFVDMVYQVQATMYPFPCLSSFFPACLSITACVCTHIQQRNVFLNTNLSVNFYSQNSIMPPGNNHPLFISTKMIIFNRHNEPL